MKWAAFRFGTRYAFRRPPSFSTPGSGARRNFSNCHSQYNHYHQKSPRPSLLLDSSSSHQQFCRSYCGITTSLTLFHANLSSSRVWRENKARCEELQQLCQLEHRRKFTTSSRKEGLPLWCLGLLKSSGALSFAQTVYRIAMTILPIAYVKRRIMKMFLKHFSPEDHPSLAYVHRQLQSHSKGLSRFMLGLIVLPGVLFAATLIASLERTPLTGRWRLLLLSPEEEQKVAEDLVGDGWYNAVASVLAANHQDRFPAVVPLDDWRTQWVLSTMRRLEAVVPLLHRTETLPQASRADVPFPPPSQYPLLPRPRVSTVLHHIPPDSNVEHTATHDPPPHTLLGPPYALLVLEEPKSANAFSYGFGPQGAGGIVVYSGFIDRILRDHPSPVTTDTKETPHLSNQPTQSFLSKLFGTSTNPNSPQPNSTNVFTPTEEQTTELAILLAHEMSHLILSHHLESLSSGSYLIPTLVSIMADVIRTITYPVTMFLGPFVNDGLLELTRAGAGQVMIGSESCSSRTMEIEADVVSARLLAYAGFDPRAAVEFWESRAEEAACSDTVPGKGKPETVDGEKAQWFSNQTHPISEERVTRLKAELDRWERAKSK